LFHLVQNVYRDGRYLYFLIIVNSTGIDFDLFEIDVDDVVMGPAKITMHTTFTFLPLREEKPDPVPLTPANTPSPHDPKPAASNTPPPVAPITAPFQAQAIPTLPVPAPASTAVVRTRNSRRTWIEMHKEQYAELWYWEKNKAGRATRLWGSVLKRNERGIRVRRSKRLETVKGTTVMGICM
jgi:hypothetical protein